MEVKYSKYNNLFYLVNGNEIKEVSFNIKPTDNCKVYKWEGVANFLIQLNSFTKKEQKFIFNGIKNKYDGVPGIFLTLSSSKWVDTIKENFNIYYCIKVPIGYGSNINSDNYYQYHILIKSSDRYKRKMPKVTQEEGNALGKEDLDSIYSKVKGIEYKNQKTALSAFYTRIKTILNS